MAWGLWCLAPGLAHPAIRDWDEGLHQAAARGTYESFFSPHVYADPLYPLHPKQWWVPGVWLHKPTGPLWFAALVMRVVGVTPGALRLGSLLGELAAALGIYVLARGLTGRQVATAAAMGFLGLPFGWQLTQGFFFADVYDCTLVGWVTWAMALFVWSIHRDSWRWAFAAGAAVGVAYLCKMVMGVAPLGVALVLAMLRQARFCRGPRWNAFAAMVLGAVVVAAPWNVYCSLRWPEIYGADAELTVGEISASSGVDVGPWGRPVDAVFNEMNAAGFRPLAVAVPLLALVWLVVRALARRDFVVGSLALWLGSTWFMHSVVHIKAPGHTWNAVPAVCIGLALIAVDLWTRPGLALATGAALATPWVLEAVPALGRVRELVPSWLPQTGRLPGLAEGLALALAGALAGWGLARVRRRPPWLDRAVGSLVCAGLLIVALFQAPTQMKDGAAALRIEMRMSYTRELGLALDRALPARSVLFEDIDRDPLGMFETYNLMFWSGRMAYRRAPDLQAAEAKGYRAYLISPASEPFTPVPGVPPNAWLRAYDAASPAEPAPLPPGVEPLEAQAGELTLLGLASGPIDGRYDRYALYVRQRGSAGFVRVLFHTDEGTEEYFLRPEHSLRRRNRLEGVPWFVLPVVGPLRAQVKALTFGDQRVPLSGNP